MMSDVTVSRKLHSDGKSPPSMQRTWKVDSPRVMTDNKACDVLLGDKVLLEPLHGRAVQLRLEDQFENSRIEA